MNTELYTVLSRQLKTTEITAHLSQDTCDTWDSVAQLNLIVALEIQFGVSFEPEEIAQMRDVPSIEAHLRNKGIAL